MAQIGLKLDERWFQLTDPTRHQSLDIQWQSFEQEAGFCQYQLADWQVFVWGDCAMRANDALILNELAQHQQISVFGRSWLAIHRQNACIEGGTDQLGLFPLLLCQQNQQWYICSDRQMFHQILGKAPRLSISAMQQMLCFGQILDDSSIVEGMIHLSAARHFRLHNHQLTLQHMIHRQPLCEVRSSSFEQALESFVESIRQSMHYAVNPLISLSGGLDSRLILAACLALGKKPAALCYGNSQSDDHSIARQIAEKTGLSLFTGSDIRAVDAWQTSRRISFTGLGEVPMHHAHALVDNNLLAQTRDSTLLTGTGAEAYRAFYYDRGMPGFELFDYSCLHAISFPRIQRYIREEFFRIARPVFNILPELETTLLPLFEQKLASKLNAQVDSARAADQFYLDVRVSRMVVAGQQLLDPYYQRCHPFLAPDVLCTLGALPASYKVASRFHRLAIQRLAPSLAEIPWDKTGLPLNQGLSMQARYPGLVHYLGGKGLYGKQSVPMFDYAQIGHLPYEHVLDHILSVIGVEDEKTRRFQVWRLMQSKALLHIKGLTEVWSHLLPANAIGAGEA